MKKDKAFFFFGYGGLRQVVGQFLSGGVLPTANERLGDFTADSFKVDIPGTKTQVDGNEQLPELSGCETELYSQGPARPNRSHHLERRQQECHHSLAQWPGNTWTGFFTGPTRR